MCISIYIYTCMYQNIFTHKRARTHTHTHTHTHAHTHIRTHAHTHTHTPTPIHTHTHTQIITNMSQGEASEGQHDCKCTTLMLFSLFSSCSLARFLAPSLALAHTHAKAHGRALRRSWLHHNVPTREATRSESSCSRVGMVHLWHTPSCCWQESYTL